MQCVQVSLGGARLDAILCNVRHDRGWAVPSVKPSPACPEHGRQIHVLFTGETAETRRRSPLGPRERKRVGMVHRGRDGYLGHSPSNWEADHRIPIQSRDGDEVAIDWSDDEAVRGNFQVLRAEHNKTKNAKCMGCPESSAPTVHGRSLLVRGRVPMDRRHRL